MGHFEESGWGATVKMKTLTRPPGTFSRGERGRGMFDGLGERGASR
jgi:hypothetical protein